VTVSVPTTGAGLHPFHRCHGGHLQLIPRCDETVSREAARDIRAPEGVTA
jgi:hypothetical protein